MEQRPGTPKKIAAFFDLDGTLLSVNSGKLWMERERREGRLTLGQLIEGTLYVLAYKVRMMDMDFVMTRALRTVRGVPEDRIRDRTSRWFFREVARHSAPGAWSVLERHREAGHMLVLLTLSSPYESAAAVEHFGLDAFLSTRYEVRRGAFTGEIFRPACYGAGKVFHAERLASERGLDLDASYFYTDSHSDLPMLERVGHPRVVNPDLRLRLIALRREWEILDWQSGSTSGPCDGV